MSMTRRLAAVLVSGVLLSFPLVARSVRAGEPREPGEQTTSFRSGVNLVTLMVVVQDRGGRFVPNLEQGDFTVFEDDVPQELQFFSGGGAPLDLAILLDTSSSMRDRLSLVQEAATGFVRTLQPADRGAVVEFNARARFLSGFTSSIDDLEAAIRSTEATGGTALYNALYVTLSEFARLPARPEQIRRQAIVVLSDGADTTSLVSVDDVVEQARRARVKIYTVSLVDPSEARLARSSSASGPSSRADRTMTTLARDSGARSFFPSRVGDLASVYSVIAEELSNLYVVGYASSHPHDGTYRSIRVQILTRANAFARTQTGYVAAAPPAERESGARRARRR